MFSVREPQSMKDLKNEDYRNQGTQGAPKNSINMRYNISFPILDVYLGFLGSLISVNLTFGLIFGH